MSNWINWSGTGCPVPDGTLVQVRLNDGHVSDETGVCAGVFTWHSFGSGVSFVVAYRVLKEAKPAADGWIDWNESLAPPDDEAIVQVRWRSNRVSSHIRAKYLTWRQTRSESDPVAYRVVEEAPPTQPAPATALDVQVGGNHYKDMPIQPVEFIHANALGYFEGNVIKYVSRWRKKNGVADLEKARHYIDLLIDLESKHADRSTSASAG